MSGTKAGETFPDGSESQWGEVLACVLEIEWFATRKKDLAAKVERSEKTWGDMLMSDIVDLRRALSEIPGSPFASSAQKPVTP